jgi:hypothetical protein
LVAVAVWAVRGGWRSAPLVAFGTVLVVLVVQSQAAWWQMTATGKSFRTTMAPDLEWVDHHGSGPVALLAITQNSPAFDDIDFFNRSITAAYEPATGILGRAIQGTICTVRFDRSGLVVLGTQCGPTPHRFLINDPSARVTFQDEVRSWSERHVGRLVDVAPGRAPRIRSLVVLPCPRRTPGYATASPDIVPADSPIECAKAMTGALWLDDASAVAVTYRGGARTQHVEIGGRTWTLPPRVATTVTASAPAGYSQFVATADWTSSVATPVVERVVLRSGGRATTIATP